jgi:hypothetical protein
MATKKSAAPKPKPQAAQAKPKPAMKTAAKIAAAESHMMKCSPDKVRWGDQIEELEIEIIDGSASDIFFDKLSVWKVKIEGITDAANNSDMVAEVKRTNILIVRQARVVASGSSKNDVTILKCDLSDSKKCCEQFKSSNTPISIN